MLPRALEPEVMDSAEEARDYDAMDHAAVNAAFVTDFLAAWDGQGTVLDVGTGTAQIPIELCRRQRSVQVVAIDLAGHMLEVGRLNVARACLADRLKLEPADAKNLPYSSSSFDAVISNSIVHHIPEPAKVLNEIVRVVKPGGVIFIRDLLRPNDDHTLKRLVSTYAGNANAHQQQMFAESLHAALTLEEIRALVASLKHDPASVKQTTDRHWTWQTKRPGNRE